MLLVRWLVYLVIQKETGGRESDGEHIEKRGKFYGISLNHMAEHDRKVAEGEYASALNKFRSGPPFCTSGRPKQSRGSS